MDADVRTAKNEAISTTIDRDWASWKRGPRYLVCTQNYLIC